jgi:hypothetical protein
MYGSSRSIATFFVRAIRKEEKRSGRGEVMPRVNVEEKVIKAEIPPGSRFKGYEPFLVQDLVISCVRPVRRMPHEGACAPGGVAGGRRYRTGAFARGPAGARWDQAVVAEKS